MKRIVVLLFVLSLVGFFLLKQLREKVGSDFSQPVSYPSSTPRPTEEITKNGSVTTSLFVPYWTMSQKAIDIDNFDQYIYFGLIPTEQGIFQTPETTKSLKNFTRLKIVDKKKMLVIIMTDSQRNFTILKQNDSQKTIITDSIAIAKKEGFYAVMLDLEVSAIPFPTLEKQITVFSKNFHEEARKNNLSFQLALYGDTFYRIRPFDVKTLANNSDMIWIMAYDFTKKRGGPGPIFPLHGKEKYSYDMTEMINDFLQFIPSKKISVVFGLYGYDWIVDDKGNATASGSAITDTQIQKQFITACPYKECLVQVDNLSEETKITYKDKDNNNHVLWYEDMKSIGKKEAYLKERGITSFSYWAYSYF